MKKKRKWFMAVTADKYELPLSPPLRQAELASYMGVTVSIISHATNKHKSKIGVITGHKYISFYDDDLDELEQQEAWHIDVDIHPRKPLYRDYQWYKKNHVCTRCHKRCAATGRAWCTQCLEDSRLRYNLKKKKKRKEKKLLP